MRPCGILLTVTSTVMLLAFVEVRAAASSSMGASDAQRCFEESRYPLSATGLAYCSNALRSGNLTRRDEAATFSNRGIIHAANGRFAEALRDHERAIELMPDMGSAFVNRGNVFFRMRDFAAAISDFDRAIALNARPAHVAHLNRALALIRLDRTAEALAALRQAQALDPESDRIAELIRQLTSGSQRPVNK